MHRRSSGLSQKQFCRRQALALSTFSYWKRRIEKPAAEKIKFYPLSIAPSTTPAADSGLLLLIGKKRFAIEVKEEFSPTVLKKAAELAHALGVAAKARGMSEGAKSTGITREALYKELKPNAKPRFDTINKVCAALGVRLVAHPTQSQ